MNKLISQTRIDAAQAYEVLFVPALFGQWATIVGLDVACGTGVLARKIATRVRDGGYVVGLDPNPGMLFVANDMSNV
ncbi:MAG: methyltransferase domain-containing protein [Anaerolineales bacterium]|nr:methyltransferase domain-containing protein [Anaerolineales bacterium]